MKKIILGITALCMSAAFSVYADSTPDTSSTEATKPAEVSTQPDKTGTAASDATSSDKTSSGSSSVYESVRSGWNDMIDAIAPPSGSDKQPPAAKKQ